MIKMKRKSTVQACWFLFAVFSLLSASFGQDLGQEQILTNTVKESTGHPDPLTDLAVYLLDKSTHIRINESEEPWRLLNQNQRFQSFLQSRNLHEVYNIRRAERYKLLGEFLKDVLAPFSNPDYLSRRQSESLSRSLFFRRNPQIGIDPVNADGYITLREISANNLRRLTRSLPTDNSPEAVERIMQKLSVVFVHNTHVLTEVPESPLVSSRILQEVSGIGGLNTYFFNRKFLNSDDNIFFFVLLQAGTQLSNMHESLYGEHRFSPEESFAQKQGWISAYIMYPYDLYRFALGCSPCDADKLSISFAKEFPKEMSECKGDINELINALYEYKRETIRWNRMLRDYFGLWNSVKRRLSELDFTVTDFRVLTMQVIRSYLTKMHQRNPHEFEMWQKRINGNDPGDLLRLSYKEMCGLDLYFEFKIPVAIPGWGLRKIN